MGSWKETCGISHLPIDYGEEIVIIPLCAIIHANRALNPRVTAIDKNYAPLCFPIKGTYNGYGGIEGIEVDSELLELFNRLGVHKNTSEEGAMKIPFATTAAAFEQAFNAFLDNPDEYGLCQVMRAKHRLDYMIIQRDVFNFLVNKMAERSLCIGAQAFNAAETGMSVSFSDLIEKRLNDDAKQLYLMNKKDEYGFGGNDKSTLEVYSGLWAKDALERTFGGYRYLSSLFSKYCNGEYASFVTNFKELVLLSYALEHLRMGWLCQTSGRGWEGNELQLHLDLAEFIVASIKRKQEEWLIENTSDLNLEETIIF